MWPFSKRSASRGLPIDGPWAVAHGQNDGKIIVVRTNVGYRRFGALPGYEYQAGIAVPFRAADSNGLPSTEESAELILIEDLISNSLTENAEALLVAVITTNGMGEFVLYTRAPQLFENRFRPSRTA